MKTAVLVAALALAPAAAFAAVTVEKPEIRASLGALPTAAAYMTLRNSGPAGDRLTGASCACAGMVMVHRSSVVNGVSRMSMEAAVAVPAGGSVVFAPNGLHLMLTGLKGPIAAGAKVPITLTFEKAGKVQAVFVATATPGAAEDHAHMHP